MRIQCLKHVNFEGPASIETWARERGLSMEKTDLSAGAALPGCDDFDWLVVMGGPMNVHEESAYPWLAGEKRLIGDAIGRGRLVLGVCLGAQLIASVLGAAVYRNSHREIGWFAVNRGEDAGDSGVFSALPASFVPFHWHGDTFDLPRGCERGAWSEACAVQAFEYGRGVVALQFHLESTRDSIEALIEHGSDELAAGPYVQSADEMRSRYGNIPENTRLLYGLLDKLKSIGDGDRPRR